MGTPRYMAPEQWRNEPPDARVDVWGLGVTLYELLALRPAFAGAEVKDQVLHAEPVPLRERVTNVPADLVAICRKAMRKAAAERYQTAQEFAEDLRRWLRHEPTKARPARAVRRLYLWGRRNPGWASALAIGVIAIAVSWGLEFLHLKNREALARANAGKAEAEAAAAEAAAEAAREQERGLRRDLLVQQMTQLRLSTRWDGWSKRLERLVQDAAEIRKDLNLRNQAAAGLSGLDGMFVKRFDNLGASSIAFDATGKRLLLGGLFPEEKHPQGTRATVWEWETGRLLHTSSQTGPGPVVFRADGTPLQLLANATDRLTLQLWDVAKNRLLGEFKVSPEGKSEVLTEANLPLMAFSPDSAVLAAAAMMAGNKGTVVVWDTGTGKVLHRSVAKISSLAISPDNNLLATGNEEGQITLHSLPKGEHVASLKADRMAILCLAFQRSRCRREPGQRAVGDWLLAAGDTSGTVTVWDCGTGMPRTVCRGANFHVHAVAFSPDGMTVASAGRGEAKLWDIATGRLLLNLKETNWLTDVAFSRDGRRLAVGSKSAFLYPVWVDVWGLEPDRAIQTLRGLASQVEKVVFSRDERFLAALSHDSRVAVWNLQTGELLHVFEAPPVTWPDNAVLIFNPDSTQLAFAGSDATTGRARLWDIATGREVRSWTFSPGLHNILAFHPPNKLLLFQMETRDGKRLPDSSVDRRQNPPVCRVRDLLSNEPDKPLFEITEFNWRIDFPSAPLDGRFFVLVGYHGRNQEEGRRIVAFDGLTGKEFWSSALEPSNLKEEPLHSPALNLDPSGRFLTILRERHEWRTAQATLVEMPSGKHLGVSEAVNPIDQGWSPDMPYWIDHRYAWLHLSLARRNEKTPVVVLGLDVQSMSRRRFNAAGTRLAWGNVDGTVNVCDIPAVQRRLAAVGLGW